MVRAVEEVWQQTAEGLLPLVVGGFITSTAMVAIKPIEQRLRDVCDDPNPDALNKKLLHTQEVGCCPLASQDDETLAKTPILERLRTSWAVLKECKKKSPSILKEQITPLKEAPSDFFTRSGQEAKRSDRECMLSIVRNIVCSDAKQATKSWLHTMEFPVASEIHEFCCNKRFNDDGLPLSFGLLLLYESYRSFFSSVSPSSKAPSSRLETLRFAQEIVPYVTDILLDPSMPCRCLGTIALHLEVWERMLKDFLREKNFSLYSQCPWTCGSQVVTMLRTVSYYGQKLLSYQQFVGTVLHSYHILCKFTGFPKIMILDFFIYIYETSFFPGGLPDRNFTQCGIRYCGGRLYFDEGSKHQSGCHSMQIPGRHAARDGSGLLVEANSERLDLWKKSWFYAIPVRNYNIGEKTWEALDREARLRSVIDDTKYIFPNDHPVYVVHKRYEKQMDAPSHRLQRLMLVVFGSEFIPEFPTAQINFFKLYMACVKVVEIVSDRGHPDKPGNRCQCFFEILTKAADAYNEHDGKEPFGFQDLIGDLTGALTEVFVGVKIEEWFWQCV